MSKYIITGGTGYLGFVLVNKLLKENLKPIKVLVRSEKSMDQFKHLDVEISVGSLNDETFLLNEINENDIIFHLAAMVAIGSFNEDLMYKTNVLATKLIADISSRKKVSKFIYVSSTSAIYSKDKIIKEPTSFNHKKVIGKYAKTKSIASEYIDNLIKETKLKGNIVYPSLIIGPYDYRISSISNVILKYMDKKIQPIIKGSYNFIDVRDLVNVLIKVSQTNNFNSYLVTNETKTIKEMFKDLDEFKSRKTILINIPLFLVKLVLPFITLYYKLFNKEPIFTHESIKIINENNNFDNNKIKKDFNIEFTKINNSFKDMVDFFRSNNFINK